MAKAQKVSKNTVNRLWQLHNIKPHLSRTFKPVAGCEIPREADRCGGLYMKPPGQGFGAVCG